MKNLKKVILDASPAISLALLGKLELLEQLFDEIYIPGAVWEEITGCGFYRETPRIRHFFTNRVKEIERFNDLIFIMDHGESEAVLLYKELEADYLVIDDRRARVIAEELDVNCIGTLSILMIAREKGFEKELRPLFVKLLENKRYFKISKLNTILSKFNEETI